MKVGILTLPFHTNYGGFLQAYALKHLLLKEGHEVYFIDNAYSEPQFKKLAKLLVGRFRKGYLKQIRQTKLERKNFEEFRSKYLTPFTENIRQLHNPQKLSKYAFDALVVGSDQVWRKNYDITRKADYFFDFSSRKETALISYAASFGVDQWEYNEQETEALAQLAQKFKAVSVRENSGIPLCQIHLKVPATQLVDPTLVLDKNVYLNLVGRKATTNKGGLCTYILDPTEEKTEIIDRVCKEINLKKYGVGIKDHAGTYPAIADWIEGFANADYIVTDSFHGCVFSIIFNKPFIAIGNAHRGLTRFNSLLELFDLEERLVTSIDKLNFAPVSKPLNWDQINQRTKELSSQSLNFLRKNLQNHDGK
ncbi:polysaccharide pyruvyl transferase family protein [Mangrovibacterium sp.]|uniref:polysaccharide pyruvyl transferase family protein n=1 Tax=Mangrovibacterium sp. TaxID=1961364 RepID=UPI003566ACEA